MDARFVEAKRLSVIVVALGEDPRVRGCLDAVAKAAPDAEIILIENGVSGDGSPLGVTPSVRLRRAGNPGYCTAMNEGFALATGEQILSLNPDATITPSGLAKARQVLAEDPRIGAIALRLVRPDGVTLDSAGIRIGFFRRPRDRGMGRPEKGRYSEAADVDAACMAGALFRKSALDGARDGSGEILDSRFFAYKEDSELGWRLRRAGFRVRYLPDAIAHHERGWREGARARIPEWLRVLSLRNRWLMILKNERISSLLLRSPFLLTLECVWALVLLFRERGVLRAYPAIWKELPESLRRRPLLSERNRRG